MRYDHVDYSDTANSELISEVSRFKTKTDEAMDPRETAASALQTHGFTGVFADLFYTVWQPEIQVLRDAAEQAAGDLRTAANRAQADAREDEAYAEFEIRRARAMADRSQTAV